MTQRLSLYGDFLQAAADEMFVPLVVKEPWDISQHYLMCTVSVVFLVWKSFNFFHDVYDYPGKLNSSMDSLLN